MPVSFGTHILAMFKPTATTPVDLTGFATAHRRLAFGLGAAAALLGVAAIGPRLIAHAPAKPPIASKAYAAMLLPDLK